MQRTLRLLLLSATFLGAAAAPAAAQSGFALKGHYIYNRSLVDAGQRLPAATGLGLGAEVVLPFGLGLGAGAYTAGRASELDDATTVVGLVEANYFFRLPLALSPYVGVHAGLGSYSRGDNVLDETRLRDNRRQLGYQFGLRFQPVSVLGFDAQYRRVSEWANSAQDTRFERGQVLLGITLF